MTVKALKKQLMAAIAMVVVSAIALSSSTYAWFASNNQVSATGMQVQAQTEGGIEIAYSSKTAIEGSYSTSASTGASAAISLAPTSTLDTTEWYHASAKLTSASEAKADTYTKLNLNETAIDGQAFGKTGGTDTTKYYMVQTFNIRSTSADLKAKGLTVSSVSVAGSTASKKMNQALRVAIVLDDGKTLIYDPVANDTTRYAVYNGFTGTGDSAVGKKWGDVTCQDKDTAALLAATSDTVIPAKETGSNGGVDVKIYVYYEGEDTELFTENYNTEGLTITVNFSATV